MNYFGKGMNLWQMVATLNRIHSINLPTMRIVFTLLLTALFCVAQVRAGERRGGGITFSPNLSFVTFKGGDELTVSLNKEKFRAFAQTALMNGTFFIEKKYFKEKFALGVGMGYRQLSEETKAVLNGDVEEVLSYVHDYATLPMYMRIYVSKKWYIKTGLTSMINLDNSLTEIAKSVSSGKTTTADASDENRYSWVNFSNDWGIGYTFVKKRVKMDLESVYTYNLMGLLRGDVDVNTFQSTLGVAMTIRI